MASPKLDAVNQFISATKKTFDLLRSAAQDVEEGVSQTEVMRRITRAQLDLVKAAHALSATPSDPEADKAAGAVLLERISRAVAVKTMGEWGAAADVAIENAGPDFADELSQEMKDWMEAVGPLEELGMEALSRSQEQAQEAMIEGFRRGAAQTPGVNLLIEEVVNGVRVREETVLGPEAGHEDSPELATGYLPTSKADALGVDDDRLDLVIERLNHAQGALMLGRHSLPIDAGPEDVRLAVAGRLLDEIERDLDITLALTGDLPAPIRDLTPQHFPALRAQLLMQHQRIISEGSVYSRAMRGDRPAAAMLRQFMILADMLSFAEPYYLRADQIPGSETGGGRQLPGDHSFLVWHDNPLPIGGDVHVIAWVFATDETGELYDAVHVISLHADGALEATWGNLRQGIGAPIARRVASSLRASDWQQAKPLRLPGKSNSVEWKKALVRSAARAKAGALHGLRTVAIAS